MPAHVVASPFADWVSDIQRTRGWNPTEIARKAGISPSTILRPIHSRKHKSKLSLTTLQKIAAAASTNIPAELLTLSEDVGAGANESIELRRGSKKMSINASQRQDLGEGLAPSSSQARGGGRARFASPPHIRVNDDGRVELPASLVSLLDGKPGEALVTRVVDGVLTIETVDNALRRVHASVRRYVPEDVSLVDELIAERRREAALE